jgi:hypothetical protein
MCLHLCRDPLKFKFAVQNSAMHRMTSPMKSLLATLAMMTGATSAQQRTFYDSSGKVVDRPRPTAAARRRTTMREAR